MPRDQLTLTPRAWESVTNPSKRDHMLRTSYCQAGENQETPQAPRRLARHLTKQLVTSAEGEADEALLSADEAFLSVEESLARQLDEKSDQLDLAEQSLVQSNRAFQQFVNAVSHDLQTPLRAITGFSQYLQQEYQETLDSTANEYISRVIEGAGRLEQQVKGLTLFSRVTSKAAPFETVDLGEIVQIAIDNVQSRSGSSARFIVDKHLPDVLGDRAQLILLLECLLDNSVKFHGDSPTVVHVGVKNNANHWTIAVKDNGIGIAKEHRENVFTMFRRLNVQQKFEGVGAGLAICRRIVERHQGNIWLYSIQGVGTSVFFTIPMMEC